MFICVHLSTANRSRGGERGYRWTWSWTLEIWQRALVRSRQQSTSKCFASPRPRTWYQTSLFYLSLRRQRQKYNQTRQISLSRVSYADQLGRRIRIRRRRDARQSTPITRLLDRSGPHTKPREGVERSRRRRRRSLRVGPRHEGECGWQRLYRELSS